ncbi:hypothetical protein, partial [Okeania sp.]|uniref:hypothetical protein n=1 Tax=Okeania sp. TaxID=3100323 RepID=UPI002B4B95A9
RDFIFNLPRENFSINIDIDGEVGNFPSFPCLPNFRISAQRKNRDFAFNLPRENFSINIDIDGEV